MNTKTTNVLLILLLIVGAYFVFFEKDTTTTYEREQATDRQRGQDGNAVFTADEMPSETVHEVTMQTGQDPPVVLVKEGQDWYQDQPVRFGLNTWSARQVVQDIAGLRYTQRFDPATSEGDALPTLGQAALDPPRATVTVRFANGQPIAQTIALGDRTVGGSGYARINDDSRVYIVDDTLHRQVLDTDVTDWRKRSIDAPTEGQASRVTLTRDGDTISATKTDGVWSLDDPHSGRADAQVIGDLLGGLGAMSIRQFVADNPTDLSLYGLDEPWAVLSVYLPPSQQPTSPDDRAAQTQPAAADADVGGDDSIAQAPMRTLRIGAAVDLKEEEYFATWSARGEAPDVVFTISASDREKLVKSVDQWRDARITTIKASDARRLTIERPQQATVDLLRSSVGWTFADPGPGFEADGGLVSALVDSITAAKAQAYEPRITTTAQPLAVVRLEAIGRTEPDVLRVYPLHNDQGYGVLRNHETTMYRVATAHLASVFEPAVSLRERTALNVSADQLTRLAITHEDGRAYVFERQQGPDPAAPATTGPATAQGGTWTLMGQEQFESVAFQELLDDLLPLRTQRWLETGPQPRDSRPPSSPAGGGALTVAIETADGHHHAVSVDTAGHTGSIAAGPAHETQWFELSQELVGQLSAEFRLRNIVPLTVQDIEAIEVIREDGAVRVGRDETDRYVAQSQIQIDQAAAGQLFDTVAGLRVDRFIPPQHVPQPPLRMVIHTRHGKTYRLAFLEPQDSRCVATDGDQWFTVNADTFAKLNAPLAFKE